MKKIKQTIKTRKILLTLCLIFFALFLGINGFCGASTHSSSHKHSVDINTIYVNNNTGNDSWNGLAPVYDGINGPKKTVKNAVNSANNKGAVKIANGFYSGSGNSNIQINKNITIMGQSRKGTIISGSDTSRIFDIINGSNVTIKCLTLINGQSAVVVVEQYVFMPMEIQEYPQHGLKAVPIL
ncbi:MAG: hypothetical protein PHY59_05445 [Methanobacterium sp.]|nr:hypothetical protein [Methanobacterium sp.]